MQTDAQNLHSHGATAYSSICQTRAKHTQSYIFIYTDIYIYMVDAYFKVIVPVGPGDLPRTAAGTPPRTYYSIDSISCQFTCQCDTNTPRVVVLVGKMVRGGRAKVENGKWAHFRGGRVQQGVRLKLFITFAKICLPKMPAKYIFCHSLPEEVCYNIFCRPFSVITCGLFTPWP